MVSISFLGDVALNGNYRVFQQNNINPFIEVQSDLQAQDFVIGNLECLARGSKGENMLKKPRIGTEVETLQLLKKINLSAATLAHNHIFDHLAEGYINTTTFLKQNNIDSLGASIRNSDVSDPLIKKINGLSFCFLNYVTRDTNPNLPENATIYLNYFDIEKAQKEIKEYRGQNDYVVLLLHWGGRVEGGFYPDWNQPIIARKLIDSGADLIIGHHTHTIQPFEIFKGKYIFYSLGNFCFSDFVFNGEKHFVASRGERAVIITVTFNKTNYSVNQKYFKNQDGILIHYERYEYKIKWRQFIFKLISNSKLLWNLYFFYKKYFLSYVLYLTNKKIDYKVKTITILRKIKQK
jgi:poly-gamma-glutamate synthesis protein (capsule biosynthesis protein)